MKQRLIALLLMLALMMSVCAVSALAEEPAETVPAAAAPEKTESGGTGAVPEGVESEGTEAAEDADSEAAPSLAGPDLAENITVEPDRIGEVSFANVERRMRENNLQILALEQSIQTLEEIDYEDLYEDLRLQLNEIAKAQWALVRIPAAYAGGELEKSQTLEQLEQAYSAVRESFDAIKEGDMQQDNADIIRQLKHLQDQIVVAGESLYVALTSMETQEGNLLRQREALNRTVEEMELRYTLGQISAMQLSEVKAGRTALESGLATLQMNIETYKLQLEMLLGAEQTGRIRLGAVPGVTADQLKAMDLEADLAAAKERSYELYDAKKTLEDAGEEYQEKGDYWGYNEKRYEFRSAKYAWQSAQYTYNNTVQNYELKFRTLGAQVEDYRQIWEAAKVSLACEKETYASMELKYQQGTVSQNALLSAMDDLQAQESAVKSAAGDLFSAYNSYCWAVQHGILN